MWTIRFILIGMLGTVVFVCWHILRHRSRYKRLPESKISNIAIVIVYQSLCYLVVVLPSAGSGNHHPDWLEYRSVCVGFAVMGSVLICAGIVLSLITLRQRKAIGMQDIKEGLLTSGVYRYFRHPIYTGIIWITLGLALVTRNPDGLLMFPVVFAINFALSLSEERNDMGIRYHEQYVAYKQAVRMFGPIWLWCILIAMLLLLTGLGLIAP